MTNTVIYPTSLFPGNYVNEAKGIDKFDAFDLCAKDLEQPYRPHDWNLRAMASRALNWTRPRLSNATVATFTTLAHISTSKL